MVLKTERDKIQVNEFYQTNIPGYYAIGDVVPGQALAHVASAEGNHLCGKNQRYARRTSLTMATYLVVLTALLK